MQNIGNLKCTHPCQLVKLLLHWFTVVSRKDHANMADDSTADVGFVNVTWKEKRMGLLGYSIKNWTKIKDIF